MLWDSQLCGCDGMMSGLCWETHSAICLKKSAGCIRLVQRTPFFNTIRISCHTAYSWPAAADCVSLIMKTIRK